MLKISVVGIGVGTAQSSPEDVCSAAGWAAINEADRIIGDPRQLALIQSVQGTATQGKKLIELPRPLLPKLREMLVASNAHTPAGHTVVLASGDPMFYGIGATLHQLQLPDVSIQSIPFFSSITLACNHLGWAEQHTEVYSLVSSKHEDFAVLQIPLEQGLPFLVLGRDASTPGKLRAWLPDTAQLLVLSDLSPSTATIRTLEVGEYPESLPGLHVLAVLPSAVPGVRNNARRENASLVPGREDAKYEAESGQLTKQHMRALAVAALAPMPGDHLWDIGGGSGSIAIEFLRATHSAAAVHPRSPQRSTATVFEQHESRAALIMRNAQRGGVSDRLQVLGRAPDAFADDALAAPSAVFIGGGLTVPGLGEAAWERLLPGGVLVAHAVTLESLRRMLELHTQYGGSIHQMQVAQQQAVGSFHVLRPAIAVHQWVVTKEQ